MVVKRLAVVLAAVLCGSLYLAAPRLVAARENWTSVRSQNFFLIGNGSEKDIRQVAVRLEQFRWVSSRLLPGINFNSPVPTTVVVFKSESSYRPFKPNANNAGFFQSGPDVNYIALTTELSGDQDAFNVIFHEYTHLLVNNTSANVPTWFNEGLAEYYSTFSITDDQKIVVGKPIASHVFLLRANKMVPLRTLFKVDQQSPYYNERDKQSIFYAESWALIHYLIRADNGQHLPQLGKFLSLIETNIPLEEAFNQAFQISFETMEKQLREYVSHDRYPIFTGHFENKIGVDTAMQTAPISEAEAQAYLGDLLWHSNRAEGEAYLQRALSLDPQLAMANASLGMLRMRQGKVGEARKSLENAVASNSKNYLSHYYLAYVLSREGMDETQLVTGYPPDTAARIRDELKKAIDLRPDYPESYNLLAFVNLVTATQLEETIQLLKKTLAGSPGRHDLLFTMAQVYLRLEDYKTARQILERLSQINNDERLRQQAEAMLKRLAVREDQIAVIEARKKAGGGSQVRVDGSSPQGETETATTPRDPSALLQEALRGPGSGEKRAQGSLVRIECDAKGITFFVKVDEQLIKLHAEHFEEVQIVAFTTEVGGEITCGPRKPENAVVICYVANGDARRKFDGTLKSLEFVPKDFKLRA
jgi:tetratricopeptide (TPR) repeat protein